MPHFSPNTVAGCISNVECSVGGNLELRQTIPLKRDIFAIRTEK
jgi:hypothetical protein